MVSKVLRAFNSTGEKVAVAVPLKTGKVLQVKLNGKPNREEFAGTEAWIQHLGGQVVVREETYTRPKKVKLIPVPDHPMVEAVRLIYYANRIKDTLSPSGRAKLVVPRLYAKLSDDELLPVYFNSKTGKVATDPYNGPCDPASLEGAKFYVPHGRYKLKQVEATKPRGTLVCINRYYAPEHAVQIVQDALSCVGDLKVEYIDSSRFEYVMKYLKQSCAWYANVIDVRFKWDKTLETIRNIKTGSVYNTFADLREKLQASS